MNQIIKPLLSLSVLILIILSTTNVLASTTKLAPKDDLTSDRITISSDAHVKADETVATTVAVFGNVYIEGRVEESAVAIFGDVAIGPQGSIQGDAVSIFGQIRVDDGGSIIGSTVQIDTLASILSLIPVAALPAAIISLTWLFKVLFFIGFLLLAIIMVTVLPEQTTKLKNHVLGNTLQTFLLGLAAAILILPSLLILLISVIGIALIPLAILLIIIMLFVGYIAVATALGERLLSSTGLTNNNLIWWTTLGLTLLWLIGWIPIVGILIKAGIIIIGLGSVISTLFKRPIKK